MSEKRQVEISGSDLQTTAQKLEQFGRTLGPNEQVVVDWLLQRAASAPVDSPDGDVKGYLFSPTTGLQPQSFNQRFTQALGYGPGIARPGDLNAVKISVSI